MSYIQNRICRGLFGGIIFRFLAFAWLDKTLKGWQRLWTSWTSEPHFDLLSFPSHLLFLVIFFGWNLLWSHLSPPPGPSLCLTVRKTGVFWGLYQQFLSHSQCPLFCALSYYNYKSTIILQLIYCQSFCGDHSKGADSCFWLVIFVLRALNMLDINTMSLRASYWNKWVEKVSVWDYVSFIYISRVQGKTQPTVNATFENKDNERRAESEVSKLFHWRNVIFLAPVLPKDCYFQSWIGTDISEPGRRPYSRFKKKRQLDNFLLWLIWEI